MVKAVSFKESKEKDLIEFIENEGHIDNFSYYVKNLIRADMNKVENKNFSQEEKSKKGKRNTNFVTE